MSSLTVLLPAPALDVTYLVDALMPGQIHRPRRVLRLAGGKGLNLARVATRLGCATSVIAPLGGHIGALVADLAAAEGITLLAVPVAGETRSCVTVATDAGLTEFYEPAAELSDREAAEFLAAGRAAAPTGWTVLAGSVGSGIPLAALVDMLASRSGAGERLAIDTHGAALAAIVRDLRPALVKVNRREASELLELDSDALHLARLLRDRTDGIVVVTDGENGSAAATGEGGWRVPPPPRGHYPVGSGDAFFGGLLASLAQEQPIPVALAQASAAGAANAAEPGAGLLSMDLVHEFLHDIRAVAA